MPGNDVSGRRSAHQNSGHLEYVLRTESHGSCMIVGLRSYVTRGMHNCRAIALTVRCKRQANYVPPPSPLKINAQPKLHRRACSPRLVRIVPLTHCRLGNLGVDKIFVVVRLPTDGQSIAKHGGLICCLGTARIIYPLHNCTIPYLRLLLIID
jgi:hypothetical protein